jgi:integrase/recombinase XerC/integrase/recombinase XerD
MATGISSLWHRQAEVQLSLRRALELFEAAYRAAGYRPRTIAWYQQRLGYFFVYLDRTLGREPTLSDFTKQQFRLFILEKQAVPRYDGHPYKQPSGTASSAYLHGFFRAVRGFSSWLAREGLLPSNVMADLQLPKIVERELEPLTPDEELRLLSAYSESNPGECRTKAILMLMLSTGIRKGELITLKDDAVNLGEGFVTVWGKGRRQRSVPFGYKTGWVLQRYRSLHRPEPVSPSTDEFFLTVEGYALTERTVDMLFARVRRKTGIARLHPHLLRHTYGTRSAELGIPTLTLQRFMGHSQPTVTERYSHIAQSERIKRERSYDHLDQLDVRVRRAAPRRNRIGS